MDSLMHIYFYFNIKQLYFNLNNEYNLFFFYRFIHKKEKEK